MYREAEPEEVEIKFVENMWDRGKYSPSVREYLWNRRGLKRIQEEHQHPGDTNELLIIVLYFEFSLHI